MERDAMTTGMEKQMSLQDTDFQLFVTEHLPPNLNRATVCRTVRMWDTKQQDTTNPAMGTELVATAQF